MPFRLGGRSWHLGHWHWRRVRAYLRVFCGFRVAVWKSSACRFVRRWRWPTSVASKLPACVVCLCGTVCENGCIKFFGLEENEHGIFTPYLDVRRRSCTLCMRCTNICPTGALTPVPEEAQAISVNVRMGVAVVDPDRCLSYLGRVCGYCHDACPYPGTAIRLVPPAKPVVIEDGCVGCGRCVELCPQSPTAIDVFRGVA